MDDTGKPYAKIQCCDPYGGGELVLDRVGPIVSVTAGFGYESGTTHLTPTDARRAARKLVELADIIEGEDA